MKKAMINTVLGAMAGTMALGLSVTAFASEITIDDAKNMALEAAGYKEEDVIFKQVNKDLDDGRRIFEVDFFVPGEVKFEFDLDAETGMILSYDEYDSNGNNTYSYRLTNYKFNDEAVEFRTAGDMISEIKNGGYVQEFSNY